MIALISIVPGDGLRRHGHDGQAAASGEPFEHREKCMDNGACRTGVVLDATALLELARCSAPYASLRRSTCSGWSPIWLMNWFVSK